MRGEVGVALGEAGESDRTGCATAAHPLLLGLGLGLGLVESALLVWLLLPPLPNREPRAKAARDGADDESGDERGGVRTDEEG